MARLTHVPLQSRTRVLFWNGGHDIAQFADGTSDEHSIT